MSAIADTPPAASTDTIPVAMVPEPITATRVMPESTLDSIETGVRESATTVGTFGSAYE